MHGYDLIGAAFLDPLRFVSIADEKVARVFEAPREFVDVVSNLHIADLDSGEVQIALIYPLASRCPDRYRLLTADYRNRKTGPELLLCPRLGYLTRR